ncbi:MAG: hypothetical protein ACI9LM_003885 [Alteromonadaceae bacterium]|jgi:hypothetical protein
MFASWSLQSPILLLALLSLLVPLAIHLFSKSKGKLVAIGNIKLIPAGKPVHMREIRLVDRFLLLCRLLILLISVLLLANLFYLGDVSQPKNTVLITNDWLNQTTTQEKQQLIESEQDSDYYLLSKHNTKNTSLIKQPIKQPIKQRLSPQDIIEWQPVHVELERNIWALVANVEKTLAEKSLLSVYSTNRAQEFSGNKVKLSRAVNWQIKALMDNPLSMYQEIEQTELSVVVISDDDRKEDVAYINAALNILKSEKLPNLTINYFSDIGVYQSFYEDKIPPQWIFYLSSTDLPESMLAQVILGSQLLVDATKNDANNRNVRNSDANNSNDNKSVAKNQRFLLTSETKAWQIKNTQHNLSIIKGSLYGEPVLSERIKENNTSNSKVLWKTEVINRNFSKNVLVEYPQGLGKIIAFHSRFNPQWNDLVLQAQFPHFILSLFYSEQIKAAELKQSRLTTEQISASVVNVLNTDGLLSNNSKTIENTQQLGQANNLQMNESWLNKILIVLLILFYAIERVLSEQKALGKARITLTLNNSASIESTVIKPTVIDPKCTMSNAGQL